MQAERRRDEAIVLNGTWSALNKVFLIIVPLALAWIGWITTSLHSSQMRALQQFAQLSERVARIEVNSEVAKTIDRSIGSMSRDISEAIRAATDIVADAHEDTRRANRP